MMYDICQGLGLSEKEYIQVLGKETHNDIIEESNKVYWVNPDLAAKLIKEKGSKLC